MVAIRGIREIVKAIDLVGNPAARLVLVGEFQEPGLEQICRAESGWRRVDYSGRRSRSEVATILGDARAGLVAYRPVANLIEAQPTKLFEYMSAGIPVIASDFPLWRRIIDGAACGILVDPHNPKEIAVAIEWILTHAKEAEEMGQRGREAVMQVYNWEQESSHLLSLYERLVK
jgi:glycosyltransferase involved in cell wall biosynthesis